MDSETQMVLTDFAGLVEAVGRRIKSPKNDPEDLRIIIDTLNQISDGLSSVRRTWIMRIDSGEDLEKSVGRAILITKENREKLSIVNGGVAPIAVGAYFYLPYDPEAVAEVLTKDDFFKRFKFPDQEVLSNIFLVDVDLV